MRIQFRAVLLAAVFGLPCAASAGGYGSAGVKDATVAPPATATATVWCPRLNTEVPISLQSDLNCGRTVAVGVARPKVARERFERGLFGLPAHVRSGNTPSNDDSGPGPFPVATPTQSPSPEPQPNTPTPDGSNTSVAKWDRLADLGVNPSNFDSQSDDFKRAVGDYLDVEGPLGDWSGFNP